MTVAQAMANAQAVTGQVFDAATLRRWLSELDGQLAFEVWGVDSWTAYSEEDLGSLLLVPYPWDGLYVHKLEAMTYFSNGEYDRYANAQRMYEEALGEFKRFVQRTRARCGEVTITQGGDGGSAVTAIVRGCDVWRYISAYGLAVLHGYEGTPEEWLESLKGEDGEPGPAGAPGNVSFDELTPEQIAMLKGDPGEDGEDGVTPAFRIGTVETLAPTAAATASISGTAAEPELNLGIPGANLWLGSKAQYDAMESHDPARLYLITRSPTGITLYSPPTKTSYNTGDALALAGISVLLEYDDASAEAVTEGCTFDPPDGTLLGAAGTTTITISYSTGEETFTTTTTVNVTAAS